MRSMKRSPRPRKSASPNSAARERPVDRISRKYRLLKLYQSLTRTSLARRYPFARSDQPMERLMSRFIRYLLRDESGATAIEYGLIAALISVAIISAVTAVGG